jgi:hypothetical protein
VLESRIRGVHSGTEPEQGDATFILIDAQNNFYVNLNLRRFENEFYDLLYQNYLFITKDYMVVMIRDNVVISEKI